MDNTSDAYVNMFVCTNFECIPVETAVSYTIGMLMPYILFFIFGSIFLFILVDSIISIISFKTKRKILWRKKI